MNKKFDLKSRQVALKLMNERFADLKAGKSEEEACKYDDCLVSSFLNYCLIDEALLDDLLSGKAKVQNPNLIVDAASGAVLKKLSVVTFGGVAVKEIKWVDASEEAEFAVAKPAVAMKVKAPKSKIPPHIARRIAELEAAKAAESAEAAK